MIMLEDKIGENLLNTREGKTLSEQALTALAEEVSETIAVIEEKKLKDLDNNSVVIMKVKKTEKRKYTKLTGDVSVDGLTISGMKNVNGAK